MIIKMNENARIANEREWNFNNKLLRGRLTNGKLLSFSDATIPVIKTLRFMISLKCTERNDILRLAEIEQDIKTFYIALYI
jgi:hypothetical protein